MVDASGTGRRHHPETTRYPGCVPLPPPPPPSSNRDSAGAGAGGSSAAVTCYRHPDRVAGRRCTRCGKPACDACLTQAAVGSHCTDCVKAARPDARTKARFWSARQPVLVTKSLIAINVAVFALVLLVSREPAALSGGVTDMHLGLGLSRDVLVQRIAWQSNSGAIFITEPDGWYRLVTSGFLHFGFIHLAFNMYFLWVLGPMLEPALGRINFLLLYLASLLGGSLGVILFDSGGITAGASGAVFGLLAAATVGLWRRGVNPFSTGVGGALILNLFITFAIPGISIGGHVGGAVAGAICGAVMLAPTHRQGAAWMIWATPLVVGVGSVLAVVAIVGAA
jgi:membrane associated rhomboid family serine protease